MNFARTGVGSIITLLGVTFTKKFMWTGAEIYVVDKDERWTYREDLEDKTTEQILWDILLGELKSCRPFELVLTE